MVAMTQIFASQEAIRFVEEQIGILKLGGVNISGVYALSSILSIHVRSVKTAKEKLEYNFQILDKHNIKY